MMPSASSRAWPSRHVLWLAIAVVVGAQASSRTQGAGTRVRAEQQEGSIATASTPGRGGTVAVTNCDDSGAGSLRDAIAQAADGDTIDLTQLTCGTITLTSGALTVAQDSLSLAGPGAGRLSISGNDLQPVFLHSGNGTFSIADVDISHGLNRQSTAFGGCIYSHAHAALTRVAVHDCLADGVGDSLPTARGGGVFAMAGVDAIDARIYANATSAEPVSGSPDDGGGGIAGGTLVLIASYIGGNHASACGGVGAGYGLRMRDTTVAGNSAFGTGGVCALGMQSDAGAIDIESSAIIDNTSNVVGGLWLYSAPPPAPPMRLVNSTVSGNLGTAFVGSYGGIYTRYGVLEIVNSTIAFNSVESGEPAGLIAIRDEVHLQSSIIANNTSLAASAYPYFNDLDGPSATFIGASNLVTYSRIKLPADTIIADPMLLPLAFNGGRTKTHALLPASPAVDHGNNAASLPWDQRGAGYPREVGPADIGAFELDADHIFAGAFDE